MKNLNEAPLSYLVAVKGIRSSDNLIEYLGAMLADISIGAVATDDAMASLSVCDKILDVAKFSLAHTSTIKALGSQRAITGGD
jgi:hypothetical protein